MHAFKGLFETLFSLYEEPKGICSLLLDLCLCTQRDCERLVMKSNEGLGEEESSREWSCDSRGEKSQDLLCIHTDCICCATKNERRLKSEDCNFAACFACSREINVLKFRRFILMTWKERAFALISPFFLFDDLFSRPSLPSPDDDTRVGATSLPLILSCVWERKEDRDVFQRTTKFAFDEETERGSEWRDS